MWPVEVIKMYFPKKRFRIFFTILIVFLIVYVSVVAKIVDVIQIREIYNDIRSSSASRWYQERNRLRQLNIEKNVTIIKTDFFKYMASQLFKTPYPGVENYTQYVVSKSKLKPLTDVQPLRHEYGAVLNDVTSFQYPIGIKPCQYLNDSNNIFVAIISAVGNFNKRESIRQTWLRQFHQIQTEKGFLINLSGYGFIIGQSKDENLHEPVEEESKNYDDILQVDIIDNYYNLTLKAVGLMNWLNNHCSQVGFLLKVDDDVYVNVRNLVAVITKSLNPSEKVFYGSQSRHTSQRGGKWGISYEDWPWSNYPTYPTGGAVLLPGIAIEPLLAAAQTTPYLPFDDTYLLGLCTEKAGIKLHESRRFFALGGGQPDPCRVYNYISWLLSSSNTMNSSNLATENFYKNLTQCNYAGKPVDAFHYLLKMN